MVRAVVRAPVQTVILAMIPVRIRALIRGLIPAMIRALIRALIRASVPVDPGGLDCPGRESISRNSNITNIRSHHDGRPERTR